MPAPLRLGIVGTGLIWHGSHKGVLQSLPAQFSIGAICARDDAKRAAALADFPAAKGYSDYRELVQDPALDAVVVLTPIALNAAVSLAALEAGKDVFVEKPFAASTAAGRAVIAAAARTGRRVLILEQLLYSEVWPALRQLITSGELGTVAMFDRCLHSFIDTENDPWGFGKTPWRVRGEFPLGQLFDGGVHELAVQAALFGAPIGVYASGQAMRREHGEYDTINLLFDYPGGVCGMMSHSGLLGGNRNYFHIRGTRALVRCEYWRLTIEPKDGSASREVTFAASAGEFFKGLHGRMWAELAACQASGAPDRYPPSVAIHELATLEAIERSIKSGQKQPI